MGPIQHSLFRMLGLNNIISRMFLCVMSAVEGVFKDRSLNAVPMASLFKILCSTGSQSVCLFGSFTSSHSLFNSDCLGFIFFALKTPLHRCFLTASMNMEIAESAVSWKSTIRAHNFRAAVQAFL